MIYTDWQAVGIVILVIVGVVAAIAWSDDHP